MVLPSPPSYNFTVADLERAGFSTQELARVILQSKANGGIETGSPSAILPLLAAILKTQKKANANHVHIPYALDDYQLQQILGGNENRQFLLIQNVGSGDLMVVPEAGDTSIRDFSAATAQAYLNDMQNRAIRIVAGGYYEPTTAPKNAMSIFTLATATNGVVVEGT